VEKFSGKQKLNKLNF